MARRMAGQFVRLDSRRGPAIFARSPASFRRRLSFEPLEDRRLLATITVTSLADNLDVDSQVTLREAILAAETNASVDGSVAGDALGRDVIQFDAALSGPIELSVTGDASFGPSALVITSSIAIQGNAAGITIARALAAPEMRLFRVDATGDLRLESLTLTGGVARGADGSAGAPDGENGRGGAILNQGVLEIVASTLFDHRALGGAAAMGGAAGEGRGGAIHNDGSDVIIANSTLSANRVGNSSGGIAGLGAGIFSRNGTLSIYSSTITDSTASAGRGVYVLADAASATVVIDNTIIGQSTTGILETDLVVTMANGGVPTSSGGWNLIRKAVNFNGSVVSTANPMLAALGDNGGPTLTHALQAGSPAIDVGDPNAMAGMGDVPLFDQREAPWSRVFDTSGVVGTGIDIGAVEMQPLPMPPELLGDYNGDHTVNAADYTVWRNTLRMYVAQYSGADGDGSGQIDEADYQIWKDNYGESLSEEAATVALAVFVEEGGMQATEVGEPADVSERRTTLPTGSSFVTSWFPSQRVTIEPRGRATRSAMFERRSPANQETHDLALLSAFDAGIAADERIADVVGFRSREESGDVDRHNDDVDPPAMDEALADWPAATGCNRVGFALPTR